MKPLDKHDEKIGRELKRCRLPEPSQELRERTLAAAHAAWPAPVPRTGIWRSPVFRLGLAAAASVVVIVLANLLSQGLVAPWLAHDPVAQIEPPPIPKNEDPLVASRLALAATAPRPKPKTMVCFGYQHNFGISQEIPKKTPDVQPPPADR